MAKLLRTHEAVARTGLSRTTLWRLERQGEFPPRRRIHGNLTGYIESEIDDWVRSRPVVGNGAPSDDEAA